MVSPARSAGGRRCYPFPPFITSTAAAIPLFAASAFIFDFSAFGSPRSSPI